MSSSFYRNSISRSRVARYGFAVIFAVLGCALRYGLIPLLGESSFPFLLAYPAVAAAAWVGGLGPGIVASLVSVGLSDYFFLVPLRKIAPVSTAQVTSLLIFFAASILIALLGERSRVALRRLLNELTARLQSESELRQSNEQLHVVLDNAQIALWEWRVGEGHFDYLNEIPVLAGLGMKADRETWNRWIHPEDQARFWDSLQRVLVEGTSARLEYRLIRPEGSTYWLRTRAYASRDSEGKVERIFGVVEDVTSRRKAEDASNRLAAIVTSSEDAIISRDLDWKITSWNDAATRMFGYTPEEAIGQSVFLIIPPELREEEMRIQKAIIAGERVAHYDTRRLRKGGESVDVSLTVSPILDSNGKVVGASKIARDITDRMRAELALRRTEMEAAKGRVAAVIAHEINNPLEAITNLGYLLAMAPELHPASRELLESLNSEVARVSDITRQALAYYREGTKSTAVSLNAIVDGILDLYRRRIAQKSVNLEFKRDEDLPLINVKAGELRQIVSNLVGNALDAVPNGGTIRIRTRSTDCHVRITVSDNGHGIPPERRKRIFQPFETSKGEKGTGLGLWVSKGLVEKYGGRIRFRSSLRSGHQGTSFMVVFPRPEVKHASAA